MAAIKFHYVDLEIVLVLTEYLCAIISKMEKLNLNMFEGISADYGFRDTWICRLMFMYMCHLLILTEKLVHVICNGILFK